MTSQPKPDEPHAFDARNYPRTYRPSKVWQALLVLVGLGLAAVSAILLVETAAEDWILALIALGALAVGVAVCVDALRSHVVLHADAIEVHGWRGTRTIKVGRVLGWRRSGHGAGWVVLRLVLAPGSGRSMRLPVALRPDEAFGAWFARLPDLDAADHEASRSAIAGNAALGRTPEERLARFDRLRGVARHATWIVLVLLAGVTFLVNSSVVAMLALCLLPLLMLAAVAGSRGVLRLGGPPQDVRPDLLGLFGLACAAPLLRVSTEINLSDWVAVMPASVAVGCLLGLIAIWVSGRHHWRHPSRLGIVPLLCIYSGATLAWIDVAADHRAVTLDRTTVSFKHVGDSSYKPHAFSLLLDPWGSVKETQKLTVSQAVFNSVSPGETVCVRQHPGLWGWGWRDVAPCDEGGQASAAGMPAPLYRALKLRAQLAQSRGPYERLLQAGRYEVLEAELSQLQHRFENGEIGSDVLLVAYRDFYDSDPDLDALFDAWISQFPKSYAGHLARGVHRKIQADVLHAAGFERWVSPDMNVEPFADRQRQDLEYSARLTAKPSLSYVHLMDIAMHQRQPDQMRKWLDLGLSTDREGFALRRKYLAMLRPIYGGSVQQMEAFVAECRQDGTPPNVLNTLEAMLFVQQGWRSQLDDKNEEAALDLFRRAIALKPFADELNMALQAESSVLLKRGQFDAAAESLRRAVAAVPQDASAHRSLGYALQMAGRKPEGIEEYRRAAELGDSVSQSYLGGLYWHGDGVPRDVAQAARWINRAAAAGDAKARQELTEHPELRSF